MVLAGFFQFGNEVLVVVLANEEVLALLLDVTVPVAALASLVVIAVLVLEALIVMLVVVVVGVLVLALAVPVEINGCCDIVWVDERLMMVEVVVVAGVEIDVADDVSAETNGRSHSIY
ncbi:unnamed protein product [Toxocara canis]|uniref:Uncharacterized protein n=1 Tax=Toxocara canis TaxID=6265 RepID=A0A183UW49_TOXCA|nr:unnamed protein product [Toxocara canis]